MNTACMATIFNSVLLTDGSETIKINPRARTSACSPHTPRRQNTPPPEGKRRRGKRNGEPPDTADRTSQTSPSRSRYAPRLQLVLAVGFSATMARENGQKNAVRGRPRDGRRRVTDGRRPRPGHRHTLSCASCKRETMTL